MNRRPIGCLVEIAETLVLTLVIFLVIQAFVAQPYQVQQESMRLTLEEGQYVLVDKLTPNFDDYSRGDIIVFTPPNGGGSDAVPFIKRVIGEPGDMIEIRDGQVYVNGALLDEPYLNGARTTADGRGTWQVPEGTVFVMGDNRNNSTDSRSASIGPVPRQNVIGRAFLRYWPLSALGILPTPTYDGVPPAESQEAPAASEAAAR